MRSRSLLSGSSGPRNYAIIPHWLSRGALHGDDGPIPATLVPPSLLGSRFPELRESHPGGGNCTVPRLRLRERATCCEQGDVLTNEGARLGVHRTSSTRIRFFSLPSSRRPGGVRDACCFHLITRRPEATLAALDRGPWRWCDRWPPLPQENASGPASEPLCSRDLIRMDYSCQGSTPRCRSEHSCRSVSLPSSPANRTLHGGRTRNSRQVPTFLQLQLPTYLTRDWCICKNTPWST